jgi:anion-transporting  ArsA/GET3 family ATPase
MAATGMSETGPRETGPRETSPSRPAPGMVPGIPTATRLHIVTGKGGTGKTTVAAALAVALAQQGQRVLLVEVEGRQALAPLFDTPALPYAEQRLITTERGGEVVGLAVDPELALLEYLELFYNLKRAAQVLRKMGAIDFVTTLAPGLRDVLLTGKVKEAVTRRAPQGGPAYGAVVLDAPPTGRIRQFLDATREVANLARVGPINRQSKGVIELLHSGDTVVHLVTLLEEMPVQETVDAAVELTAGGFRLGCVIVNRVRPTLVLAGQINAKGTVSLRSLTAGLDGVGLGPYASALAEQMQEYAIRQSTQEQTESYLDTVDRPRILLPDLTPPIELGELNELASYFHA